MENWRVLLTTNKRTEIRGLTRYDLVEKVVEEDGILKRYTIEYVSRIGGTAVKNEIISEEHVIPDPQSPNAYLNVDSVS